MTRVRLFLLLSALAIAVGVVGSPAVADASDGRPNVILIMADDVGRECFGCYGSEQYDTPRIDALAKEGLRFTHAYSQPVCTPSRVEIMTGRSNIRNYVAFGVIDPRERTFAEVFREAGYATAVAGKWQLYGSEIEAGPVKKQGLHPDDSAFQRYSLWQVWKRPSRYGSPGLLVDGEYKRFGDDRYGPNICTEYLLDFIEENRDRPFFAYYPMNLPHGPFHWPPGAKGEKGGRQAKYEAMVHHLDKLVGRIVDHVDKLGLTEETLILFTGDNGSPRGIRSRLGGRTIRGAKSKPIEAGMHVPFVARMPDTVPAGETSGDLIGFSDVLPTLVDFAGVEPPEGTLDGVSFAPQLRGKPGEPRQWLFSWYTKGPYRSSIDAARRFAWDKRWKLYDDGELYHIADDPREKQPIEPGEGGAEARKAREKLRSALESMPGAWQARDCLEAMAR